MAVKAKRSAKLSDLANRQKSTHQTITETIAGTKYTLRTLDPFEEAWADQRVSGETLFATAKARRAPYVACALMAIDDEPVETCFAYDPSDPTLTADEKNLMADPEVQLDWRRTQILEYVRGELAPATIEELYSTYVELVERRNKALEGLGPFSRRTRLLELSATSSRAKASSSQTPSPSA